MRYNHMFDMAFSVETDVKDPERVSAQALTVGILSRLVNLLDLPIEELREACGHCDTYENKGGSDND